MPSDRDAQGRMSRRNVRRTQRAVLAVESSPLMGVATASSARPYTYAIRRARVTVAIPSGSWAAPSSSGKVRLRVKNSSGTWVDGDEVRCFNDNTMPAPLPVNRVVKVGWIEGDYWLLSASCS